MPEPVPFVRTRRPRSPTSKEARRRNWRRDARRPTTALDLGDLEVIHPRCRRPVLITSFTFKRVHRRSGAWLQIEGICRTCDRYVHLGFWVEAKASGR